MRASFDLLIHHSRRVTLLQWPGRAKGLPPVSSPTILASGNADVTSLLLRGMGPKVAFSSTGSERNIASLDEDQALRALLLLDVLDSKGGASEAVVDHLAQLTKEQTLYWVKETTDPIRGDRARRALRTLVS